MDKMSLPRTLVGSGIILVGVAALLGGLNIIDFSYLFQTYWPMLVIAAGLLILLINPREEYLWGLLLIAFGILWQMKALEVVEFNTWALFWPLVIMAVGWAVLTNRAGAATNFKTSDTNAVVAVLGGVETKDDSANYTGSKITAVVGGSALDLRSATIKNEATIDIFALMGGVEIKVPENWTVRSSVVPILGGVDNKTKPAVSKNAPVLNITGTAIMGGVDIKH